MPRAKATVATPPVATPPAAPPAEQPEKPRPSRTIPTTLHRDVVQRLATADPETGRPYTARAVAAWLGSEHGVRCSHMAVLRVQAAAAERGEQLIVAALREELRDAVAPVATRLLRATKRLDASLRKETSAPKLAAGVRSLTSALDTLAKLSGVAKPIAFDLTSGGQPLPDAYAQLAAAVARLRAEPAPGGVLEAGTEPPA